MAMDRTKNTIRNTIWGIISKITNLFFPFVIRTALIYVMGAEYLGLSSLFTSILTVLNLAELGVSSAIVCSLYKPIAENDKETICALMNFYKKVYRVIGLIIGVLGMSLLPFLNLFIKSGIPEDMNIYILYLIYLGNTVVSYFLFAYKNCLFVAHQRTDVSTRVGIVCGLVQNSVQVVLLLIFKNYYIYAIIMPVFSMLGNVVTAMLAHKAYPEYICSGKLNKEVKEKLKKQILGLMIGRISGTIRASIDSLFVSIFLGLIDVAKYNNYFYIVTAVTGLIQLLEGSMVAGVGNSLVTETVEKNYRDFNKFTFMLQGIVGICAICVLCLTQPFMVVWVGEKLLYKDVMAILCAAYLYVLNISLIRSIYTQASGMWWELKYLSIIDIFVNLFLNCFLGYLLGAYGILLASVVDVLFVSIPWTTYFLFKGYFGREKFSEYMKKIITYMLVFVIIGGITWVVCNLIQANNKYLVLIIRAVITVGLSLAGYYIVFRKNSLYIEAKRFVKGIFIKSKCS